MAVARASCELAMETAIPTRRRSDRIAAPVRIRVIGNDAHGVSFGEETITVSFNQQGARISLSHSLLPDDIVLVKNLDNGIEEEFRVVGGFQPSGSRREWGVEALNQDSGIWGVAFVPPAEGLQPKVLIECAACKRAAQTTLSSIEYDVLLAAGLISRHCERCNETTRWKPSDQPLTAEMIAAGKPMTPAPGQDKRKVRRLKLVMRLRVRSAWGVVDIAQTRDVSKSGLCFVSTQRFQVGDKVFMTLPFAEYQAPVETEGTIVWAAEGTTGRFYGVQYLP